MVIFCFDFKDMHAFYKNDNLFSALIVIKGEEMDYAEKLSQSCLAQHQAP